MTRSLLRVGLVAAGLMALTAGASFGQTGSIRGTVTRVKLVSHEWHDGGSVTAKDVERAFEAWGEYKGLAFWFWDWKYTG